jgi:dTDP-4-dehydrorhamnose 3,5-epimerase
MIFTETILKGAYIIDIEPHEDERGFFARTWCQDEFREHGLTPCLAQCNISFNKKRGTLRGLHYQTFPFMEEKLVRCTFGEVYDVIVDLRSASPTFKQWVGIDLTAENRRALFIPNGFAHGFQTLTDNTEVFYQMSEFYHPECGRGVRWNDPVFEIKWPENYHPIISESDQSYADFNAADIHEQNQNDPIKKD